MDKLDKYEEEILRAYENDELKSGGLTKEMKEKYVQYARNTFQKNKRINIRISEWDLLRLKAKSLDEGIPFQALVSSLIHKYVKGTIEID
ncbi:MAG: antitoxin [Candidatus Marinimicrobia bacterium]|nr:antitoxin [Candidatus Neomarinimicrobiota bacterium]MCF7841022.1 antitoxin [Candidatus Neomarinimicrobiota bacterium]